MGNILAKIQTLALALLGSNSDSEIAATIRSELCVKGLRQRAQTWRVKGKSWTAEITTSAGPGSPSHYITCPGHHDESPCLGRWSRRLRQNTAPGLHCVFGSWVMWDGSTVVNVEPIADSAQDHMVPLRQLWADHILAQTTENSSLPLQDTPLPSDSKTSVSEVHAMLEKAIAKKSTSCSGKKTLGHGTGGSTGLSNDSTTILKRDTRDRAAAQHPFPDRCDLDLGGIWSRGDVDAWMPFLGWSALVSRDGRFRPAYHLNALLANWTTIIDYGLTRPVYRQRTLSWMRATEVLWADPPLDVTAEYVAMVRQDAATMMRKERERSEALTAVEYKPDEYGTSGKRNAALQDRAGQAIAYHGIGEGLDTPRGLVAATAMSALNDIQDYERDVLAGETNNIARGLRGSEQQVVDLAGWTLEAMVWAMEGGDEDLGDVLLGSVAIFMIMWRYNTPKMARYKAVSMRGCVPGTPPELGDVAEIVRSGMVASTAAAAAAREPGVTTYGELYRRVEERARELYAGCCCVTLPEGHEARDLLAQAMDERGNDETEHRLLVACVALNNGAQRGNAGCDCGLDLLLYESFVRFFNPDTGIVARVHYRTDITKLGNTVTE